MKKDIKARIKLKDIFKKYTSPYVERIYIWPKTFEEIDKIHELNREIHWMSYHQSPMLYSASTDLDKRWWFISDPCTWTTFEDMNFQNWIFWLKQMFWYYFTIPVKRIQKIYRYYRQGYPITWYGEKEDEESY